MRERNQRKNRKTQFLKKAFGAKPLIQRILIKTLLQIHRLAMFIEIQLPKKLRYTNRFCNNLGKSGGYVFGTISVILGSVDCVRFLP
jgi:hypothetical protein